MESIYLVNSRIFYKWGGGLNKGDLISNFDPEERDSLEGGLIERGGLIRAFTVHVDT